MSTLSLFPSLFPDRVGGTRAAEAPGAGPAVDVEEAIRQLHDSTALYTRDPIVEQVFDVSGWPRCGGRLLDPGCGDGQFTLQAVARLDLAPDDVEGLAARVEAWEIYGAAAAAARARLAAHLRGRGWSAAAADGGAERVVHHGDFLVDGPTHRRYRLVVGNPPYLRALNLPDLLRARYAAVVPEYARGDILFAFLDRAVQVLTDDGVLVCVTADRWLINGGTARLREEIGRRFGVQTARRLDSASAFYSPKTRRRGTPARVHPVAVALAPAGRAAHPLTRAPFYPETPGESAPCLAGTRPLGTVPGVRLRLAPWLGTAGVFTMAAVEAVGLPAAALVPCIDRDDIVDGVVGTPTRVALRTERGIPCEAVLAHLESAVSRLSPRARRQPFWLPPESWGELPLAHEALLVPRIATEIRVVRLPAGVLPFTHNLTVLWGPDLDALAAAITAPDAQAWMRHRAGRLENGFFEILPTLLRDLPVRFAGDAAGPGNVGEAGDAADAA